MEKLYGIITAVLIMLVVPVLWSEEKACEIEDDYLRIVVDDFARTVGTKGVIEEKTYIAFVNKINQVASTAKIDISVKRTVFEPDFVNGVFNGNIIAYYSDSYHNEILNGLEINGLYDLRRGDVINICLYNKELVIADECICVSGEDWR